MSIDTIDINLRRRRNLGVLVVVSGFWEVSGLSGPRDVFFRVVWASTTIGGPIGAAIGGPIGAFGYVCRAGFSSHRRSYRWLYRWSYRWSYR